jgi:putative aldouronate transport system substrate-binding protein
LKKSGVLILLAVMMGLMVACSGGNRGVESNNPDVSDNEASSSTGEANQGEQKTIEPVTVNAMWMYDWFKGKKWGQDPVTRKITADTGVTFNLSGPGGDGDGKANVMLVSGDYPEVMWMDRGPTWDKYVSSGALYAIDELAEKYGMTDLVGNNIPQTVVDNLKHPDGHLYGIPNWFNTKGENSIGRGTLIRNDIYNQLGEPEIKSIADFEAYLYKVRDSNPTFNGAKVYPLGLDYSDTLIVDLSNLWGSQNTDYKYYDEGSQQVKFFMYNDSTKQELRWLNKMYREKMIDPENFTYNMQTRNEAYNQGKYAASFGTVWDYWSYNEVLKKTDSNVYYKAIPAPAGNDGVKPYFQGYSTVGWNVAVITKNAKNPEAIMRFFDYYMKPEGQILSYYGLEGKTWEMVDGQPRLLPGVYEEKQKDWEGYGVKTGVRYLELNQNQAYNWENVGEAPEKHADRSIAEATGFDGTALNILSLDATSSEGIAWAEIKSELLNNLTKILLSDSEATVDARIEATLKKYEGMGLQAVEQAWTKKYEERKELIN